MSEQQSEPHHGSRARPRFFLAGVFALIPIWITFVVVSFVFRMLSNVGKPLVKWISGSMETQFPWVEATVSNEIFLAVVSFLVVLILIHFLGMLTTWVVGKRLLGMVEAILNRVPLVRTIYGSVKKLTSVLQEKPADNVQRVVLIEFPTPEMKTVGLVTQVMTEAETGRKLAAVYVPTTPNPTSGYLEIVPLERLTPTDWTMDEAMNFVISGGTVSPENIVYTRTGFPEPSEERKSDS